MLSPPLLSQAAEPEPDAQKKLEQLERRMQSARAELDSYKGKQKKLKQALRNAEQDIGKGQRKINATTLQLDAQRQQMATLERQQKQLGADKAKQQQQVAQAIREAYQHGTQNRIKLILNQEDPASVARLLNYYDYFNKARQADIELYVKTLQELQELKSQLHKTQVALQTSLAKLNEQQRGLKASWQARNETLTKLDDSIKVKGKQLAELKQERQKLEALVAEVEKQMAALDIETKGQTDGQSFSTRKGQMGWPTTGRIRYKYGARKAESQLSWQGVLLRAEAGAAVQAVHHGRIVFADWFGGSGLLLIIDHGNGYMSLYAHNQSILKEAGEWVSTGETIATVGQSGGKREPALYFEIRKSGKPIDPAAWCRAH
ncbi:MAG: murein hydrolase activator EnvC family protein [Pseudomonadales bacterium]